MNKELETMTSEQLIAHFGTVSATIRELSKFMSTSQIAKRLNKRYQHVRNVLITPVKNPKIK